MKNKHTRTRPIMFAVAIAALMLAALSGGNLFQSASAQRMKFQSASAQRMNSQRMDVQRVSVDRGTIARAESYTGDRFNYFTQTPNGARVASVSRPRAEALRAIDTGLADLFAVARRNNYRARLNYSDYVVFIARADRTRDSTGVYSPDIAFDASYFAGRVNGRGGTVYVAGLVSSYSPGALVIAEHERDWQRMADVVRYEGEHLVLYHNDRRRFQETADHTRGAHPILK